MLPPPGEGDCTGDAPSANLPAFQARLHMLTPLQSSRHKPKQIFSFLVHQQPLHRSSTQDDAQGMNMLSYHYSAFPNSSSTERAKSLIQGAVGMLCYSVMLQPSSYLAHPWTSDWSCPRWAAGLLPNQEQQPPALRLRKRQNLPVRCAHCLPRANFPT